MPRSPQEHSSGPSRPQSNPTVSQAVASYLSALPQEERNPQAQELNSFARWFGPQRTLRSMSPPELERYQEQLAAESRTDLSDRLEALRAFLVEARQQGLIDSNLAVQIKLKKKKGPARPRNSSTAYDGAEEGAPRMTRAGYDKLAKELHHLETQVRRQVATELRKAAADKDFRENAPYDVAKQHQGEVEARIRDLKRTLETGQIVEIDRSGAIDLGSKVTLRDLAEDDTIVYTLVGPGEIDPKQGRISIQSPVGKALSGKRAGDEVEVEVPAGRLRLRVEKVENR